MAVTHPITLHEDEQSKVVQLNGEYHPNNSYEVINELKVIFTPGGVELYRFESAEENKCFGMSTAEADAFVSAYETFQAEQQIKKLAELKRQEAAIAEAHALLAELPIGIVEQPGSTKDSPCWYIRSESIKTISYHAYGADNLLERTKLAVQDHERHLVALAIHDQIKAIKESCNAIKVHGYHAPWHVVIETPDLYGEYARTPEELLERVKQAALTYDRWLAEEDQRLATLQQARSLAETCPAITINGANEATAWCIVMQNPGFFQWAHSAKELLETVKRAKGKYEEWQADQTIAQQEDDKWRSDAPTADLDELIKTND